MKKILISILLFTLFSCSWEVKNNTQKQETVNNNTESIKDVASQTATGIEVWTGITQQPVSHISNISHTEVWFDGFSLAGNVSPDIEKMEIVWKNNAKTNTYTLQKYQKWNGEFKSNLKQSFWNLEYWENIYNIKAYIWEKIVDEKEYKINYEKKWCEITLKSQYNTLPEYEQYQDKFQKYAWKVRRFAFNILWNCEDKIITLANSYVIDNRIEFSIQDIWTMYYWGRHSWVKPIKQENISKDINIMMWPKCNLGGEWMDQEECEWNYVSWYFSSVEFLNKSWTQDEMNDTYNKLKFILSNMRELPLEEIKLDEKRVDLNKIQISWDTISFSDKNGLYKSFKILDYAYFQWGWTFEDIRNNPGTDLTFIKLANGKLYAEIYQWDPMSWGLETKLVFDINTGKVLSKKENDISPEGN